MPTPEFSSELEALRTRLAEVEREQAEQRANRRTLRRRVAAVAIVGAVIAGTAYAANGNCPNGMPVCFAADTPALASDVNLDFAQLKQWLETKVGPVDAGTITATGATVNGTLTVSNADLHVNNGRVTGQNATGDLHVGTSGGGYTYLDWFSGSSVAFGDGAQHLVGRMDNTGTLFLNNYVVNSGTSHHAPSVVTTVTCAGATCVGTCPAGMLVKMAFGFHGMAPTTSSGDWLCGSAFQWEGQCIGQTSCTVITQCATSSLFIECW
jgi:hypothetical protein